MKNKFTFLGALPEGKWEVCVIDVDRGEPIILVVERNGHHAPRAVIDGKLVEL